MLDTAIQVRTDHFDGPLALLLHLIEKEEMDIKKLDLRVVTGQYLSFITQMQEVNFDMAGDYLFLAATLLLLKSNVCLTFEDQEKLKQFGDDQNLHITSQAELIRRLEELQYYQKMAQKLWSVPKKGHEVFLKPKVDRKSIINSILTPVELQSLTNAMIDMLRREKKKFAVIRRDRLSIKEKLVKLKSLLVKGEQTDLDKVIDFDGERNIENIVITFISLLELARLNMINIFQNENYSTVYVNVLESLENFNVDTATGFDAEADALAAQAEILPAPAEDEKAFIGEVDVAALPPDIEAMTEEEDDEFKDQIIQ